MKRGLRLSSWVLLCSTFAACSSTSLEEEGDVQTWANTASAVGVWSNVNAPIAFANGESTFGDPTCPAVTDDGTTVTLEGGCTDTDDVEWVGSAIIERSAGGDLSMSLDRYGHVDATDDEDAEDADPTTLSGSVEVVALAEDRHAFDVDLTFHGWAHTTTFDYSGEVEGGYEGRTVWNGSGTVIRDGFGGPNGEVDARTEDQVLDGAVCSGQSLSGRTTLVDECHTVVVTYDGATDCDEEQSARWTLDGEDQGRLEGIGCSAASGAPGTSTASFGLFALVLAVSIVARARSRR